MKTDSHKSVFNLPGNQRADTGSAAGERNDSVSPCGAALAHRTLCIGHLVESKRLRKGGIL